MKDFSEGVIEDFGFKRNGEKCASPTAILTQHHAPFDTDAVSKMVAKKEGVEVSEILARWECAKIKGLIFEEAVQYVLDIQPLALVFSQSDKFIHRGKMTDAVKTFFVRRELESRCKLTGVSEVWLQALLQTVPDDLKFINAYIHSLMQKTEKQKSEFEFQKVICHKTLPLAARADLIVYHSELDVYDIVDFKTNDKLTFEPYKNQTFYHPLEKYGYCSYMEYMLQLAIMREILESHGVAVRSAAIWHWDKELQHNNMYELADVEYQEIKTKINKELIDNTLSKIYHKNPDAVAKLSLPEEGLKKEAANVFTDNHLAEEFINKFKLESDREAFAAAVVQSIKNSANEIPLQAYAVARIYSELSDLIMKGLKDNVLSYCDNHKDRTDLLGIKFGTRSTSVLDYSEDNEWQELKENEQKFSEARKNREKAMKQAMDNKHKGLEMIDSEGALIPPAVLKTSTNSIVVTFPKK